MVKSDRWTLAAWLGCALGSGALGCDVSNAPASTGGVSLDGGNNSTMTFCPSAVDVVSSDFMASTNISVLSPTGASLSSSIISSASAAPGLTSALSGDVVLPLGATPGRIVIVDRGNAVLTWVDPSTADVLDQLSVATGFASNPHDYLQVSPSKAYVTRYETNRVPGRQANDGGGDLLVVQPGTATDAGPTKAVITGRVPFVADATYLPRPDHIVRIGSEVWVTLQRWDAELMSVGDARLVGVSTADDSIAWTLDLPGVANCGGVDVAPSGKVVAIACTGGFGDTPPLGRSAIVLVDASVHPPVELKRIPAAIQLGAALAFTIAFASEGLLVGTVFGDSAGHNDLAFSADIASGATTLLLDSGAPFALGDVRCSPGCTDLCFLADAQAKAMRLWRVSGGALVTQPSLPVDPKIDLPPRTLGAF